MAKASFLKLSPKDNVAIALRNLGQGEILEDIDLSIKDPVMRGHKFAIQDIPEGHDIMRYGQIIGQSTDDIPAGSHVHSHNFGMAAHQQDYAFCAQNDPLPVAEEERVFNGYLRDDGKAGTRNYVGILTTVNCAGSVAKFIAEAAEKQGLMDAFPNVDGVVPIMHGTGCGMASHDEGFAMLQRTLMGYAQNPNFGGVLIVGLGCEVMQLSNLTESKDLRSDGAYRYMTIQQEGGTRKTIEQGLQQLKEVAALANEVEREPVSVSKLVIGMQCGGSDSYSGITANPALGYASDVLIRHGGTTILSETPEIYGAEHLLTRRAVSKEVAEKLISRIHWWEDYCARNGGEMDNNPSPGNKLGGLTTILEKSLGATAKSGAAPLSGVFEYAELIDTNGLVFMDSPGFDPCSATGQIASGANLVIFTTGRGSVSGFKPSPCIKLATNSEMYRRLQEDMDLNCGDIVDEAVSIEEKGAELFELIIRIASGEQTKSEELGFGGAEFVPWKIGAVM